MSIFSFAKTPKTQKPSLTSVTIPQSTFSFRNPISPDAILNARTSLQLGKLAPMLRIYETFLLEDDSAGDGVDVRSEALKSAVVSFSQAGLSVQQIDYFNGIIKRFGVILSDMLLQYKLTGALFRQIAYNFDGSTYMPAEYISYPDADLRVLDTSLRAYNGERPLPADPLKFIALLRGKAILYSVVKYNVFFSFALNNWAQFTETFGKPPRIAKYKPGTSEAEKNQLWEMLQNFGTDMAAMVSDNVVIDFADFNSKSASADLYSKLCEFCDDRITRRILGNTLTTKAVGTGGSYAQAKVHNLVRGDILAGDCRDLDTFLSEHFSMLNHLNFSPQNIDVTVTPATDVNLLERIQIDSKLFNEIGIDFPVDYWYQTYGIQAPTKD